MKLLLAAALAALLLIPAAAHAKEFGLVFEVEGDVWLKGVHGKVRLSPKKDLLRSVDEGDRLTTGDGRALIVSLGDNAGYEIGPRSSAVIKHGSVKADKGRVTVRRSDPPLMAPKQGKRKLGAMVMRSAQACITLKSPVRTAVADLAPVLRWESCEGRKESGFKVSVVEDGSFIYAARTSCCEAALPEGTLRSGGRYEWYVVSGDESSSVGTFYVPEQARLDEIRDELMSYRERLRQGADLPTRLSFVSCLINNDLFSDAEAEIGALEREYPDNEFIKDLKTW